MKYVIFWIEMFKQASQLVGINAHPYDSNDVQLECRKSLQLFCDYRLKKAIRKLNDKVFFDGHESGKRFAKAELNDWPPKEMQK